MYPLAGLALSWLVLAVVPDSSSAIAPNLALTVGFGAIVGFALGLTGGGGSIFAVPLLVYGLGYPANDAPGVSLAAVGATAAFGLVPRWRSGEVEFSTGLIFSMGGILGAPLGAWIAQRIPGPLLLLLFAGVMVVVALRMWRKASRSPEQARAEAKLATPGPGDEPGPTCRRDPAGRLRLTSRCASLLIAVGVATGILSGLFGVGGGFVIVPALVFFSGMGIHRAVATSLLAIALISISGVSANVVSGRPVPLDLIGLFVVGGVIGMGLGTILGHRLPSALLQKIFAPAILTVAAYVTIQNVSV